MLQQLRLKNFRQHREKAVDFTRGLNVLRGANEKGKSTILEGICYGLFGISACRTSLEDMVTWGEPPASLRAELDIAIEGTEYHVKRSKSGAEIRYGADQSVTGQKEVSAFVGRLFGVDPANISKLLLAGQGDIRGALGEGSAKTSALIEDLANFDVIDTVVRLIGEKLVTGTTTPAEEKIARLMPEVEALEAALGEVPDTVAAEAELAGLQPQLAKLEARGEEIQTEIAPLAAERDRCQALLAEQARLKDRAQLLEQQADEAAVAYDHLASSVPPEPDRGRTGQVEAMLADTVRVDQMRVIKRDIEALPYPDNSWTCEHADGTVNENGDALAELNRESNEYRGRLQEVQRLLNDFTAEARELRAKKIMVTACGLCGKDVSEMPEVKAKNDEIDARLASIVAQEATLREEMPNLAQMLRTIESIFAEQTKVERAGLRFGDLATYQKHYAPWRVAWCGPELPDAAGGQALRDELAALKRQASAVLVWQTQRDSTAAVAKQATASYSNALAACAEEKFTKAAHDLPFLVIDCDALNNEYTGLVGRMHEIREQVLTLQGEVQTKRAVYDAAKARVDAARKALADAKEELEALNFNNMLLKRVRAARPIIANKLWSMVLSAVSRYLSQMRGEESVVTKDKDGFKVNAQPIEALSGSTLDLLGLAIRLALVRTFLPQSPFLILDEPSAACDVDRTQAMMGFLLAAGFDQMLIVTHETLSEQAASSLIEI